MKQNFRARFDSIESGQAPTSPRIIRKQQTMLVLTATANAAHHGEPAERLTIEGAACRGEPVRG
jgi:hypothetical protein